MSPNFWISKRTVRDGAAVGVTDVRTGFLQHDPPYKENKIPAEDSLAILDKALDGARVIASCKPIKPDDDNPPHHAANT